jgi:hypothetical protein
MKKIDLGQTIQILANIGVLAGIAFLGYELRQNTVAQRMSAYQELIASITELNRLAIESTELNNIALRQLNGDDLTEADQLRFRNYALVLFRHGDMAYFLYEEGALSDERMRSTIAPLLDVLRRIPAAREFWRATKINFVPSYREFVDAEIKAAAESQ